MSGGEVFRVVETDQLTGWDEYKTGPLPRDAADADAETRRKVTVGRYRFDVVPVEPWMSDPAAVRERHHDRHGAFPMEECGDRDCRSMAIRLLGDTEENTDG